MKRPYINYTIQELENKFSGIRDNGAELEVLSKELSFRTTGRAKKLAEQIKALLQHIEIPSISDGKRPIPPNDKGFKKAPVGELPLELPVDFPPFGESSCKSFVEDGVSILSAWTALEVLSPQTFVRPEQLAQNGDRSLVRPLTGNLLPWSGEGEKSKPDDKLFYHIVLGTVRMPEAVSALLAIFPDSRAERPVKAGEAVLASMIVDQHGVPIEEGAVALSSFGWGVSVVLNGGLRQLGEWASLEPKLVSDFFKFVNRFDEDGKALPVSEVVIRQAFDWVIGKFGLRDDLVKFSPFTIKVFQYIRSAGPPEPLLLNSFYLSDLTTAKELCVSGKAPQNILRYLGGLVPDRSYDLLSDANALERIISPENFPAARWPGNGRHPLVLLQQAAVNLSVRGLKSDGIVPVNGPPGTGKTTLLRDIVAGLVTERAKQMINFTDPKMAFSTTGEKVNVGNGWMHFYRLDERLKGYEILVASSNNKAVENVSSELPLLGAIAGDVTELRYFKTLSNGVYKKETWGMCAAVLGNAKNRSEFMRDFWWDKESGLRTYLAAASGISQDKEEKDAKTGAVVIQTPRIIQIERPPVSPEQALSAWQQVRHDFIVTLQAVESRRAALATVRQNVKRLLQLVADEKQTAASVATTAIKLDNLESLLRRVSDSATSAALSKQQAEIGVMAHKQLRPGFFSRLFSTTSYKEWRAVNSDLLNRLSSMLAELNRLIKDERSVKNEVEIQQVAFQKNKELHIAALKALEATRAVIDSFRLESGAHLIDEEFWQKSHKDKQLSSPWLSAEDHRLRDNLFSAALRVHKAFIDASAQYFRHNLGLMMMVLSGKDFADKNKLALIPDLWSSLFLVVPCISTTFASVGKMLSNLPPQSLGYVLVDEAGQALPQAAVGALMRSKRAIIVGDPVQIEPVVSLPDTLTLNICGEFLVEADRFNAPEASVQTLADITSAFVAEFENADGSRSVGVPLLVHRRCTDPMFSISNEIGYGGNMVQAKAAGSSPIRDLLGPSNWFNISGSGIDKWCPEEGSWVIGMLERLKKADIKPDMYIITPFVVVAENLRLLIRGSKLLYGWVDDPEIWPSERIGTVHTVQGREAEAVIFVLGAPLAGQTGARNWAGTRPNLLNVAVTRAKEVLYVVGNRGLWRSAKLFGILHRDLP